MKHKSEDYKISAVKFYLKNNLKMKKFVIYLIVNAKAFRFAARIVKTIFIKMD